MFMTKLKLFGAVVLAGAAIASAVPMTPMTRAQQSPPLELRPRAKERKVDERWVKKLPSGAVIELVGIHPRRTRPETWWSPNGERLSEPPGISEGGPIGVDPNSEARDFAIRVLGSSAKEDDLQIKWSHDPISYSNAGWLTYKDRAGRVVPGLRMFNATFPADMKSTPVEIGIATGPWRTEATCTPDGKPTLRGRRAVVFGLIGETEGTASLTVVHRDDQRLKPPALNSIVRVIAIDHNGATYLTGQSSWHFHDGVMEQWFHYPLSLKEIKEFQFQTRPYEWAEFKDIPLQPLAARQITP
jgi:hypothetical protein